METIRRDERLAKKGADVCKWHLSDAKQRHSARRNRSARVARAEVLELSSNPLGGTLNRDGVDELLEFDKLTKLGLANMVRSSES